METRWSSHAPNAQPQLQPLMASYAHTITTVTTRLNLSADLGRFPLPSISWYLSPEAADLSPVGGGNLTPTGQSSELLFIADFSSFCSAERWPCLTKGERNAWSSQHTNQPYGFLLMQDLGDKFKLSKARWNTFLQPTIHSITIPKGYNQPREFGFQTGKVAQTGKKNEASNKD